MKDQNSSYVTPDVIFQIVSKRKDPESGLFIFTIRTQDNKHFMRTAGELSKEFNVLEGMSWQDVYDIGHTRGYEWGLS